MTRERHSELLNPYDDALRTQTHPNHRTKPTRQAPISLHSPVKFHKRCHISHSALCLQERAAETAAHEQRQRILAETEAMREREGKLKQLEEMQVGGGGVLCWFWDGLHVDFVD